MDKLRILIAEDDDGIREGLQFALEQEGYEVVSCGSVAEAKEHIEGSEADLCLLDVTLPDGTGYELCRLVRQKSQQLPVIFLTACDAEVNVVMGLDMGADDYITKPFRVRELTSRIRSVLRRCKAAEADSGSGNGAFSAAQGFGEAGGVPSAHSPQSAGETAGRAANGEAGCFPRGAERPGATGEAVQDRPGGTILFGPITIRLAEARVYRGSGEIQLTALEYRLLLTFVKHRGQVLSRNQLLESIWDVAGDFVNDNTVSVYIKRLREKLEDDPRSPKLIQTVRGFGYRAEK